MAHALGCGAATAPAGISLLHHEKAGGLSSGLPAAGSVVRVQQVGRKGSKSQAIRENYGCEVVCFTADVGQGDIEMEGLEKKAKASGASQLVVKDLKEEFVSEYIYPCLRAGAVYERKYLLGTSMARPVIAKMQLLMDALGNDQLTLYALNPELKVVAPWREWDITGHEDAIEVEEDAIELPAMVAY
ncbi:hypothetical protein E2562_035813 [Oryza meyeriana var. granulata]|uniref:Arginosuccinate synthase-like N-terminal domain-containing protein n=1 Tax=Oryza meyeriana var. granulata TaxID=110450 RepID=A0A6G1DAT2_9ORYZ|nr:hypothetical protein E2562_035813 [Oryza meyeriana var. granulata]